MNDPSPDADAAGSARTRCPVCGQATHRRFDVDGYTLLQCPACTHQYFAVVPAGDHVASTYADNYFTGGGAGYPDYLAEGPLLRRRGRWFAERLARHAAPGRILDVGAAAGFILAGFRDLGWDAEGLEPNDSMASHARDVLGLRVATADLEHFVSERRFDAIAMIQVIAHFVDPRAALDRAFALLAPDGLLLIETWNSASLTARLLGRRWHEYSPPSVLHCFSTGSLGRLLARAGFQEVARGRPSKWIGAQHAAALLRHKLGDRSWVARLSARVPGTLALPYPAEDLVWLLLKKR